jgi:hypothetical protein
MTKSFIVVRDKLPPKRRRTIAKPKRPQPARPQVAKKRGDFARLLTAEAFRRW